MGRSRSPPIYLNSNYCPNISCFAIYSYTFVSICLRWLCNRVYRSNESSLSFLWWSSGFIFWLIYVLNALALVRWYWPWLQRWPAVMWWPNVIGCDCSGGLVLSAAIAAVAYFYQSLLQRWYIFISRYCSGGLIIPAAIAGVTYCYRLLLQGWPSGIGPYCSGGLLIWAANYKL